MVIDEDGLAQWQRHPIGATDVRRVAALLNEGHNPLQVATQLGFSKSRTYRLREKALICGLLAPSSAVV